MRPSIRVTLSIPLHALFMLTALFWTGAAFPASAATFSDFSLASATLVHNKQKPNADTLVAKGSFRFGDDANPASEAVSFSIGLFSQMIPASGFTQKTSPRKQTWSFKGAKGGITRFTIIRTGDEWDFSVMATGLSLTLSTASNSLQTNLQIGDDSGAQNRFFDVTDSTKRTQFKFPGQKSDDLDDDGVAIKGGDCNDQDPEVHPGAPELCNAADDDCDKSIDEDFPDLGQACTAGTGACTADGVKVCAPSEDSTVCNATPGTSTPEVCNGIDDNCNTQIDEGLGSTTCGVGECQRTVNACENGQPGQCIPGEPQQEICGNQIDEDCNGTADACPTIAIAITSPENLTRFNLMAVPVAGTVAAEATSVACNDSPAILGQGEFTTDVPLREGNNTITCVARDADDNIGTASIVVVRDTTPPSVVIETPTANQTVTTSAVTIAGMVNDIVTGTVNAENCQVEITGRTGAVTAAVSNRTFLVQNFPLVPGPNTLTAVATDSAGNTSAPFQVQITRQELVGQRLEVVSGDGQTGQINQTLADPLVVRAIDAEGNPLADRSLRFQVVRNNGLVHAPGSSEGQEEVAVVTDANGQASVQWTLGGRAGAGNNRVEVSALGFAAPVQFCASATAGQCDKLLALMGDNQVGVVGAALAQPFEVVAIDAGGNACVGLPITFQVQTGEGNFSGSSSITVETNGDGRAATVLTLGPAPGINNNTVSTSFSGLTGQGASFTASGVTPGAEAATRFVGVVLDTENEPIPHAFVKIENTTPSIEGFTNENGQFALANVSVGSGLLFIDGATTTRPGRWPALEFQINVISGIDNSLGMPAFLPELDSSGFKLVGGDQDVVLTMAGVEGFSMKIFANSVRFQDGSTTGLMGVTQVSNDQVPMPPSGGAAPPWVGTLQPAGVILDPPAQLTVPNSLGLPPGTIVDMFSFDHDLQQFVSVGTGTVQPDGATIVSDPGSGIRKSGWFFDCPPPPPPGQTKNTGDPLSNNTIRDAFRDAWTNSNPGPGRAADHPERHEQGGWIVQNPDGTYTIDPWPLVDGDTITPGPQPPGTVGGFHTHPNTDPTIYAQEPSQPDIDSTIPQGVPCYIISNDRIYRVNTDGTVDDLGTRNDLTAPASSC